MGKELDATSCLHLICCLGFFFFCKFGDLLEQNLSAKLEFNSQWVQLNMANTKHS